MHYDDRLATVLRVRAEGETVARIQYRQLLDLLGTRPVELPGTQVEAAYDRLAGFSRPIPATAPPLHPQRARFRPRARTQRPPAPRVAARTCPGRIGWT